MPREPVPAPPLCSEMRAVKSLKLPGARVLASVKWGDHLHVAGVTAEDSSHHACRRQCATQTRGLHLEMPHRHPGRPGREAAGCGAAANSTGRLSGPAGSKAPSARHSGRAGGWGWGDEAGHGTLPAATGVSRTLTPFPAKGRPRLEAGGTWSPAVRKARHPRAPALNGPLRPRATPGLPRLGLATRTPWPFPLPPAHCGPSPQRRPATRPRAREPAPSRSGRPPHSR